MRTGVRQPGQPGLGMREREDDRSYSWAARPDEDSGVRTNEDNGATDISVVAPFYNEEDNVLSWYVAVKDVLEGLGLRYEILAVDDGSTDGTYSLLREIHSSDPRLKVIRFRRNFGQTAAMSAGFDYAEGDVVVTIDADLQNHPEDIPRLLAKIDEGYDVVSGWRVKRKDPSLSRKLPSRIANYVISEVTGVKLHDYGCSLKAYRREVIKGIHLYGEMHRFIPAIASWMGIQVAEIPVEHSPRRFGKSKYGISRTTRVILDLVAVRFLLSFLTRPIQIFGLLGLLCGGVGVVLGLYLTFVKFVQNEPISGRPLLLLVVLLVLVGVQLLALGLLGEVLTRIYYEGQRKPTYVVKEFLSDVDDG
ncbi:MAG: glycosyltransferase family 2 protein [Chloroflexota bacterium]